MKYSFYTGSYANQGEEGIIRFSLDTDLGRLEKEYSHNEIYHPSYLCADQERKMLHAVQEQVPEGAVHTLRITEDGLEPVKVLSSKGADPCHLSMDSTKKMLYVSNYTSGSLGAFILDDHGVPCALGDFDQHEGNGPNPVRQECAHVHFSMEHENQLLVCDLGMDRVFLYDQDVKHGKIRDTGNYLSLPAGNGPRHLEFHAEHPEIVYVLCELASQVAVFEKSEDGYRMMQLLDALPETFEGENIAAAIKRSGDLLFTSNRGHDSIAVFRILEDGTLKRLGIYASGGKTPRDFAVFGDYIVAANQDSDLLTVLKINRETGVLTLTDIKEHIVRPCCVISV